MTLAETNMKELLRSMHDVIQEQLTTRIRDVDGTLDNATMERIITGIVNEQVASLPEGIDTDTRAALTKASINDFLYFGSLQGLLDDETVSEIMVNGYQNVYVERKGRLQRIDEQLFDSDEEIGRIIDAIVTPLNRHIDAQSPYVDARLPDGSRVNAIIPPLAIDGPCLTIRKFAKHRLSAEDLMGAGTVSATMMNFLSSAVRGRCNILVAGGTGSGKTTFLNVLSGFVPTTERIITIEDTAELQLQQEHVVRLETKPANTDGAGAVSIHDLVVNSLRMRPDRIIVGECRSSEALEMLQAMNTGHDGSMTTIHANSVRSSFSRLETMVLMGDSNLPELVIRQQVASALQLVVHLKRYSDGSRKVDEISALAGMEGSIISTQPLFKYVIDGIGVDGRVQGGFRACDLLPPKEVIERITACGAPYSASWFRS